MTQASQYRALADLVLMTHVAFVAFVIVALVLILLGGWRGWKWIRNPWFRALHVAAIALVVAQTWCGIICPLTTLEMHLRERAGEATYAGSFVAHWLEVLLYYDAPPWVFVVLLHAVWRCGGRQLDQVPAPAISSANDLRPPDEERGKVAPGNTAQLGLIRVHANGR